MSATKFFKGSLSTIILKFLQEEGRMYGYEITQKVKNSSQGKFNITEGALYPMLHKMEAEGILEVEVEKVDNRLRKYYRLTEKGTTETSRKIGELEEYIKTLEGIFKLKPNFS